MTDRTTRAMDAFFAWLIRHPWLVLSIFGLATVLAATQLPKTRFVTDLRAMLPEDQVSADDAKVSETFDIREAVVVGVVREEGVFEPGTLRYTLKLCERMAEVGGIHDVRSLFSEDNIADAGGTLRIEPFLREITPDTAASARKAVEAFPAVQGVLVSADGTCAVLIAEIEPDAEKSRINAAVREILNSHPPPDGVRVHMTGLPVLEGALSGYLVRDTYTLLPLAAGVVAVLLLVAYRSPTLVILSVTEVLAVNVWTLGLMAATDVPLGIIHATLPVVLIALGAADEIHIFSRYREACAHSAASQKEKVLQTMREMVRPVVLTSVTTAAGFLSLLATSTRPLRHLGLFAAVGIFGAMVFSLIVTPIVLARWDSGRTPRRASTAASRRMRAIGRALGRHRGWVCVAIVALLAASCYGISKLYLQDAWITNFQRGGWVRQSHAELNRRLRGTRLLHVELDTGKADGVKNPEFLKALSAAQAEIDATEDVGGSLCVVQVVEKLHKEMVGTSKIPAKQAAVAQLLFLVEGKSFDSLWDTTYRKARLTVFGKKGDYRTAHRVVRGVEQALARHLPGVKVTCGGGFALGHHWVSLLGRDQRDSLGLTVVLVFLVSLAALRSARQALLVVAPVLLAVAMTLGAMGYLDVPIGVATSAFSSIILGVGVDYAIHLQDRYTRARHTARPLDALAETFGTAGVAIFWDVATVVVGFSVLLLSVMPPTQVFGVMIALGVLTSFVAAFFLAPVLLMPWRRARPTADGGGTACLRDTSD